MVKKNEEYEVEVSDQGMNFEGIAKIENQVIFIPATLKGEKVSTKIIKVNPKYAIGRLEKIIQMSPHRCEPFCDVAKQCGGCSAQHIEYGEQLVIKREMVENVLQKQKVSYQKLENTIGMGVPMYYRNKAQYPVRVDSKGNIKMGFYSMRSHEIIENETCYIQDYHIDDLAKEIFAMFLQYHFKGYSDITKTGDIKHVIIRRGFHTEEMMVILVIRQIFDLEILLKFAQDLASKNENIKSIYLNINPKDTNEILGKEQKLVWGEPYIYDNIGDFKFAISPRSFFQVNTLQAEMLYTILKEKLNLTKNEILFDLYSGVGSIGIFLSQKVKQVYGIEIEKQAIEMANVNIAENGVKNAEYIAGSVEEKLKNLKKRKIQPDVIVVDPPRRGLDEKSIHYILKFAPKKIGYVSCNPATLARDLKLLESQYEIGTITPVDMFPHTSHVECCSVLYLKN